jgi:hypothetical protein
VAQCGMRRHRKALKCALCLVRCGPVQVEIGVVPRGCRITPGRSVAWRGGSRGRALSTVRSAADGRYDQLVRTIRPVDAVAHAPWSGTGGPVRIPIASDVKEIRLLGIGPPLVCG